MTEEFKQQCQALKAQQAELIALEGGKLFMGLPDRWYDANKFRCINGHVNTWIIKTELRGDACPSCLGPCCLTFNEDVSDGCRSVEVQDSQPQG